KNGAVDTDDLATHIEQRAAGVTLVDGGVGLEEFDATVGHRPTALGADNALGDGRLQAKGITDGEDHLPDVHLVTVPEGQRLDLVGGDFQHGNVGFLIRADEL